MSNARAAVPELDGLRGFAALLVVFSHASGLGLHLVPGLSLAGAGKYGVYLFFVLSAYLLSAQWLQALATRAVGWAYLKQYLLRRVLRIYPLYVLVLLAGLALAPRGLGVPLDVPAFWRHLSLQEGRDLYWSIPVEFHYYLVLVPLCVWLMLPLATFSKLVGVVTFAGAMGLWFPPSEAGLNSSNLLYYLPIFLCGSLAAWWHHAHPSYVPSGKLVVSVWDLVPLPLLALSVPAVFITLGLTSQVDALHRSVWLWGGCWALLLLALVYGHMPLWRAVLSRPAFRVCGRWSFGIYLLHMPALYAAKRLPLPTLLQGWVGLALALAVAGVCYRFIERPAIRLGERRSQG